MPFENSYERVWTVLRPLFDGARIIETVREYREFPLRLSFSSFTRGIEWLAARYAKLGWETEIVRFPADGTTVFGDRHFPLAWDIDEGWLEWDGGAGPGERLADYASDPYGVIPFSADSGGVREALLVPERVLLHSPRSVPSPIVLFPRIPRHTDIEWAIGQGCVAVVAAPEAGPDDAVAYDARKWCNASFGEGQIDRRHTTRPGFSVSPRQADTLRAACAERGPLPVRFLTRTRTYAGEAPLLTARMPGAESPDREVWLSAHAYEPNATNNCSGVAMCLAAAGALSEAVTSGRVSKPRRSIRILHGLETFGVYAYALRYPDLLKRVLCGMSFDGIGSVDRNGVLERFCHVRNSTLHPSFAHALTHYAIAGCARRLGLETIHREGSPTNDDVLNDPMFGPAWGLLYGTMYETAGFYHTNADTPERLCARRLEEAAATEAAWAYHIASAGTMECREAAALTASAGLGWMADECGRAMGTRQPGPAAARLRASRIQVRGRLAADAGARAIESAAVLAGPGDAAEIREELGLAVRRFTQAVQGMAETAERAILGAGSADAIDSKPGPSPVEDEARGRIARRLRPGHLGLGTLDDTLRDAAARLFGRRSLEYWSIDKFGSQPQLRYLWMDGTRSLFDAARACWAVGRGREDAEEEGAWEAFLSSFLEVAALLEKGGRIECRQRARVTRADIAAGLRRLGVHAGDQVMVHASLSQLGYVEDGADAVIDALMQVVTEEGVLAMLTLTRSADGLGDPPFDAATSPARTGIIPETFRQRPDVVRSGHPTHSIAAWGTQAEAFLSTGDPLNTFDRSGPWGRLLDGNGKILFFGETMGANTFMHAMEAWLLSYLDCTYAWVMEQGTARQVRITNYPAGCRGGWYGLYREAAYFKRLSAKNVFRETRVGEGSVLVAEVPALAHALHEVFREDPAIFLHRSGCRECAGRRARLAGWAVPETPPRAARGHPGRE